MKKIPATEGRTKYAEMLDEAIVNPVFIKRRNNEFMLMDTAQLKDMISINLESTGTTGDHVMFLREMPMALGGGTTKDEAFNDMIEAIKGFSESFVDNFEEHSKAPNLKQELLPSIVFSQMTRSEIKECINAKLERTRKILSE